MKTRNINFRVVGAGLVLLILAFTNLQAQVPVCASDSVIMNVPTGVRGNIQWQISTDGVNFSNIPGANSDTLAAAVTTNVYYQAIITEGTCNPVTSDVIEILPFTNPSLTLNGSDSLCSGETAQLSAPAGFTYLWSTGETTQDITVSASGTYNVTVTDTNGCFGAAVNPVTITTFAAPTAHAGADTSSACGLNPTIGGSPAATGGTGPYTYLWTPTNGLSNFAAANPMANPGSSTTYTLTVTDANGCIATDSMDLTVQPTIDTFLFTGGIQSVIVPSCADSVYIQAWGGEGGRATNNQASTRAGYGGYCAGNKAVNAGDTLWIYVGGEGNPGNSPGWNGGGAACTQTATCGAGGGASDVRLGGTSLGDRIIVAGGGGGAEWSPANNIGGDGGGLVGNDGFHTSNNNVRSGRGGTQAAGGAAGTGGSHAGQPGTLGQGGASGNHPNGHGGGGGGGYYGGGGSMEDGHGGGGSSYYGGMDTGQTTTTGVRQGNGLIIVEWY